MRLFLAHYAKQNVEKFVFYKINWTEKVEIVLKEFSRQNPKIKLEIISWPYPFPKIILDGNKTEDPNAGMHYRGQNLAINDCILRELYRSRYVASIDVDELL